jgi:lipopolysaccharide transport system ATP-binding protein
LAAINEKNGGMQPIIKIDGVSKLYRLGSIGTGSLGQDLTRVWAKMRGKEDPFAIVGQSNDRTKQADSDFVWSLRNINFSVNKGETLGVIGRNGAGKSTLLKILSRVTGPSTGSIKINGRLASLLEVGTGFHPELTGKENIFLNGAILGMRKAEIKSKLDEIIDFAGVARYIDTPVKRYSSGMYVRLAFAVAAHLDPEILVVDEVLAVGDAEFQKKCLGKMKDVSEHDGRTILFVSHNMSAVEKLCTRSILLEHGTVVKDGPSKEVIDHYHARYRPQAQELEWNEQDAPGNDLFRVLRISAINPVAEDSKKLMVTEPIHLEMAFAYHGPDIGFNLSIVVLTMDGTPVFNLSTKPCPISKGKFVATLEMPANYMNSEVYLLSLYFVRDTSAVDLRIDEIFSFEVLDTPRTGNYYGKWIGTVRPTLFNFKLKSDD